MLPLTSIPPQTQVQAVRAYIKQTWTTLRRSQAHILAAAQDPKLDHPLGTPWPVYISPREDRDRVEQTLKTVISPTELEQIDLRTLPADLDQIEQHGLLYLPHDYVVPGGRFNEMYGWDSYFIQLGLLRDGEYALAHSLVNQLLYEVEYYGTVLNGNRTYMLNRSQPPVLTMMALNYFQHSQDKAWLRSILPTLESYYHYWVVPPHLNQATGLSHYNALGAGPAPEVVSSERDEAGRTHYERVLEYYRTFQVSEYDVDLYYNREQDELTDLFYKGDRSMRESGFDPTNRFGTFSVDIIHYVPVCLNVLLYQMECDLATINQVIGYPFAVTYWQSRSQMRAQLINQFLWDEAAGLYFDYNLREQQCRPYEFATTFYPLWAGVASEHQAKRVVENLDKFLAPGGLLTSLHVSGHQWDAPFGWAPLHLFAVQGLHRYGYYTEAQDLAWKFIRMVVQEFATSGTLFEKYDVMQCSAQVSDGIFFGYSSNEIGFGWTNGVVLELLALLGMG